MLSRCAANELINLFSFQNLDTIIRLQNRGKRYRGIIQAQQVPKNRMESVIENQFDHSKTISMSLISILEDLLIEFPEHKFAIQRVRQTLKD